MLEPLSKPKAKIEDFGSYYYFRVVVVVVLVVAGTAREGGGVEVILSAHLPVSVPDSHIVCIRFRSSSSSSSSTERG